MTNPQFSWWQNPVTLLVAQVLVLVVQPLLLSINRASSLSVIFVLILLYACIGNWGEKFTGYKIMASALCLVLGILYYNFIGIQWLKIAYIQMCCIILSAALYAQLQAILKLQFIDKNSLISCINTYILAAYLGASFAWMIEVIQPGAFHINHPVTTHQLHDFVYFSFVTMATLGYGDITPVSEAAKISAVLISLFGQLYVAIFIAIILGKYLKQQTP